MSVNLPTYVMLNGFGIYHLRLAVPQRLRYILNKREIKKSLRTGNRREAIRKARALAGKYQECFDQMTDFDDEIRRLMRDSVMMKEIKLSADIFPDGTISIKNLEMDPNHKQTEKELLDHAMKSLMKRRNVRGQIPPLYPPHIAPPAISLKNLIDKYLHAMKKRCDPKTLRGYASHLETILEIIGDVPINQINRETAREAIDTLERVPPNRNKMREYKDLTLAQVVALKPEKVFSVTTVRLHVERAIALFDFAILERVTKYNPFKDLAPRNNRRPDQERDVFTREDLAALFDPEHFKLNPVRPSRYWVPLIALWSGMRMEEICQLEYDDVKKIDNVWCFDINDNGEKKLKNKTAHRLVPVHSALIRKGFLQFVETRQGAQLFHDLKRANGKLGHNFSKWFARYRTGCGITDPGKTFHSFRHNAATKWKQASVPVTKAAAIMGHTVEGQTYGRYGKAFEVDQLQEVIEMLDFKVVAR
ncbi:MAG: site-specific integrase [Desulfobulbaceae bacterium]|nr:site-specific integrase [Desulfobulbaceae bacterium]